MWAGEVLVAGIYRCKEKVKQTSAGLWTQLDRIYMVLYQFTLSMAVQSRCGGMYTTCRLEDSTKGGSI